MPCGIIDEARGGIWVDEWGRSTADRLYGVGEVSCTSVHGANRLASASLLEGLVWGRRAARHICARLKQGSDEQLGGLGNTRPSLEDELGPESVDFHDDTDIPS